MSEYPTSLVSQKQVQVEHRREEQKLFLDAYKQRGTVRLAAQAARIPYGKHHEWLETDPEYEPQWKEALSVIADMAEEEAIRRGIHGVDEPVIRQVTRVDSGGESVTSWETVGFIKRYSDRMLEMVLRALRPEKYRERVDVNARVGLSLEEIMQRGHEQSRRAVGEGDGAANAKGNPS